VCRLCACTPGCPLNPCATAVFMQEPLAATPFIEDKPTLKQRFIHAPWWFFGIILVIIWVGYSIFSREDYAEAFNFIRIGLTITISTALISYALSLIIGLTAGLGRISKNVILRNIATFYIEMVRGVPMLVLIFYIALVGVPSTVDGINGLGISLQNMGLEQVGDALLKVENKNIPMNVRAVIALAVAYGAFLAEVFRAGIQSIPPGQMEAGRSLGMTRLQSMVHIILPQAIRNILPALGNDFVAMVKDSSLVSVLAVRDITQMSRLYAGATFRFREAYTTLLILYLTMTLILSLAVRWIEKRLRQDERE